MTTPGPHLTPNTCTCLGAFAIGFGFVGVLVIVVVVVVVGGVSFRIPMIQDGAQHRGVVFPEEFNRGQRGIAGCRSGEKDENDAV